MSVTAIRRIAIEINGDVTAAHTFSAANNIASPGDIDIVTLALGANIITPPSGGTTPVACTIIPPAGNVIAITLKGIGGDTGIVLHKTDPTSIALDSPITTFVLTAAAEVVGVRLVWT